MEDKLVQGQSSGILKSRSRSRSERRSDGCEGKSESVRKRAKLRDLESVLRSEDVLKSRAKESECGSTTGESMGERDSMKLWKEMKKNGFLSSNSHGGIPMPRPRVMSKSSSRNEMIKQKMELAKKEQVDRFAKIAAPIGLLNELNPGIINHVRNSKQVHSIIEALVQSEKQAGRIKDGRELLSVEEDDAAETSIETDESDKMQSTNNSDLSHLSVKAADVASQWLDLLHQDIKGRLSALQRSRKRVRAVIRTELPLLISTELSSDQQLLCAKSCSNSNSAHRARWNALFDQMDKSLSDEEQKLENWLEQVKEMQVHSENTDSTSTSSDHHQERELAVRAAAASIYSTCNFLQSMEENQPCF